MRTLVREIRHTAGIYASVVEPGAMRVGDAVERID
jgi:MOSC domain-containing protein YiiM